MIKITAQLVLATGIVHDIDSLEISTTVPREEFGSIVRILLMQHGYKLFGQNHRLEYDNSHFGMYVVHTLTGDKLVAV